MAMVLLASRSSVITEDVTVAMNAGIAAMALIIHAVRPAAAARMLHIANSIHTWYTCSHDDVQNKSPLCLYSTYAHFYIHTLY